MSEETEDEVMLEQVLGIARSVNEHIMTLEATDAFITDPRIVLMSLRAVRNWAIDYFKLEASQIEWAEEIIDDLVRREAGRKLLAQEIERPPGEEDDE